MTKSRARNERMHGLVVRWRAAVVAACALLVPGLGWSVETCTVAAQTHAFGAYNTVNAKATTSSITLTCSKSGNPAFAFTYSIALSSGPGSYASRQMTGTGDILTYNLYTTLAHTTIWGNGTAGTAVVNGSLILPNGLGQSGSKIETVYGLIGAPQTILPSVYLTATPITVTVTY